MNLPFQMEVNVLGHYILQHPKWQRAFVGFTKEDLVNTILRHLKNNTLAVVFNKDTNAVNGVIFYTPHLAEGFVEVNHFLASCPCVVEAAIVMWSQLFPHQQVLAHRRGKVKWYKPEDFFNVNKPEFQNN